MARWKQIELLNARRYDKDGQRVSLSGSNNQQSSTRGDNILPNLPFLFIEVKHGKRFSALLKLWKEYKKLAVAENKVPVIVVHPYGASSIDTLALLSRDRHADLENLVVLVKKIANGEAEPDAWDKAAKLANELTKFPNDKA